MDRKMLRFQTGAVSCFRLCNCRPHCEAILGPMQFIFDRQAFKHNLKQPTYPCVESVFGLFRPFQSESVIRPPEVSLEKNLDPYQCHPGIPGLDRQPSQVFINTKLQKLSGIHLGDSAHTVQPTRPHRTRETTSLTGHTQNTSH